MLKTSHADILNKPYSQIKDLKLYCPQDLPLIKEQHKHAWQVFKAFVLALSAQLPAYFASPHIEKWCNGWEIRRHFFAYFKYQCYVDNAPILSVLLNRQRLMVQLDWHAYKAQNSATTLADFNRWHQQVDWTWFAGLGLEQFYVWHSQINHYGTLTPVAQAGELCQQEGWYRLGRVLDKALLDEFGEDDLLQWCLQSITTLALAYEHCHGHSE